MSAKNESSERSVPEKEKLEWIQTIKEINEIQNEQNEGVRNKMQDKIRQNPFVPIGMLATTIALATGLNAFRKGDRKQSQLMMRARVGAQFFTIGAIIVGIFVAARTKPA